MPNISKDISSVPTNIITGFLGVGKTTAILNLLKQKPAEERWAILVNEFGEVGVDGSLIEGEMHKEQGVFIREVPGGCMCCTSGLPMQIALNILLARAKPDRLIIEPTGLGHPQEVLQTLMSGAYEDVLSIQKVITLVDARKLRDERYVSHEVFNQQLEIADVIVGNKTDLYHLEDKFLLKAYVEKINPLAQVLFTQHGELELELLNGSTRHKNNQGDDLHEHHSHVANLEEELPTDRGYLKVKNQGEGYESLGWRFASNKVFDKSRVQNFLHSLNVERLKAVVITNDGVIGFNLASDVMKMTQIDETLESRIEIISQQVDEERWHAELLTCLAA